MLTVNGKQTKFTENQTVQSFLETKDLEPKKVVVELNGAILSREKWEKIVLKESDCLEVISFVGGG